jgi:hypothetical protein
MSPRRYRNDINKTIYFEKICRNVGKITMFQFRIPTHSDLKNIINCAVSHLKPEKSKRQYEKRYSDFRRLETGVTRRM